MFSDTSQKLYPFINTFKYSTLLKLKILRLFSLTMCLSMLFYSYGSRQNESHVILFEFPRLFPVCVRLGENDGKIQTLMIVEMHALASYVLATLDFAH